MFDINHAVTNLADFGLATEPWLPQRGEGSDKQPIGGGRLRPIVKVADLDTFRTAFPNADALALKAMNGGQSMRVKLQAVIRSAVEKNRQIDDEALVTLQVRALVNARGGVITASALDDDSLIAEIAKRKGLSEDEVREMLG